MTTLFRVHRPGSVPGHLGVLLSIVLCGSLHPLVAESQGPPGSGLEPERLDEVIVTARKIEESAQDLPISMQVLSADFLAVLDLTNPLDLQFNIPGLVVNTLGLNGAGFSLRGIADQGGSSQSVATHLNGVYLGSPSLSVARLFDLERIEVLKGPQGTLYGRNATGGTISMITHRPEDEASGEVEVGYGSFSTRRIHGYFNRPADTTAFRLAFIASEGDGFIRNSVDDRKFAEQDYWGLRASMLVEISEAMRVTLVAQHIAEDGASTELWLPRPDLLADPNDIRLTTVTLADPYLKFTTDNLSLDIEYELGFAKLHAVTGYAGLDLQDVDDCAGLSFLVGCVRSALPDRHHQWSQEVRLVSHEGLPLGWLVGASYYDEQGSRNYVEFMPLLEPVPRINRINQSAGTALAVFGQAVRKLGERWNVTGGLRLNSEEYQLSTIGTGSRDSPVLISTSEHENNASWLLSLDFSPTDRTLLYASVSTGFKSGGITIISPGVFDPFGPEHLVAYEIGTKFRQPARGFALDASAFYYDFDDLQVSTATMTSDGIIFETDNAANARLYGIDSSASVQVSARLSADVGAVWLPGREFVDYRNDRTGDTLSGNELTRTPEWSLTAALRYFWNWPGAGKLSARLEYHYRSGVYYTVDNEPLFSQSAFGLLNLFLNFEAAGDRWYAFVSGRNLASEDYYNQVFIQASPGYPDTYEAGFGYRF